MWHGMWRMLIPIGVYSMFGEIELNVGIMEVFVTPLREKPEFPIGKLPHISPIVGRLMFNAAIVIIFYYGGIHT